MIHFQMYLWVWSSMSRKLNAKVHPGFRLWLTARPHAMSATVLGDRWETHLFKWKSHLSRWEKKTHHDHEQLLHTASSWLWRPQCYWETKFLTYSQPPRWSLPPTLPSNYHQHHNNTGQWSTVLWSVPWSRGNFHKGQTNFSNTLSNSSSDMVVSNIRKRIG